MKIIELELLSDNIQETEKFYSKIFGFEIIELNFKTVSFKIGQSILTFAHSDNIKPKYHFAFNIPCNKIDEAVSWILPRVGLIKTANNTVITDFEKWNAKAIYFHDNNQNIVELIARFDLNNVSDDIFTSSTILTINEVGIVTDDPLVFGNSLINNWALTFFLKGPKREDFVAVGDENGLFVISKTNRNWYPTNEPGEKHFTKIKIEIDNQIKEIIINDKNIVKE